MGQKNRAVALNGRERLAIGEHRGMSASKRREPPGLCHSRKMGESASLREVCLLDEYLKRPLGVSNAINS
jgi:hypothetical protein